MDPKIEKRNRKTMVVLFGTVAAMIGLSFASVPLYDLFCRVTGFGGTPGIAQAPSENAIDRVITVRFDAGVNPALPWRFAPAQGPMEVRVGDTAQAFYRAQNIGERKTVGTATFNVTPLKAGRYVDKIDCFCFTEQALEPGETVEMGVSFFIDPAIAENPNLDDVHTITLSYTFFEKRGTQVSGLAQPADTQPATMRR